MCIDAWKREIRAARGQSVKPFAWEQYPAISQLTLTTWNVFEPYRENDRLRPFDFLAVGVGVGSQPCASNARRASDSKHADRRPARRARGYGPVRR
jgi:hypothetical protein